MEGREWVEVHFDGRRGMIACADGWIDAAHCVLGIDAEDCTERQFAKAVTEYAQGYTFTFVLECGQRIARGRAQ